MSVSRIGNLSLSAPNNSLLNCFGIQPIFHKNWKIDSSYLGFVYRVANCVNLSGKMHYMIKSRMGDDNDVIINNKFHINDAPANVIKTILKNSFTLKHNTTLDVLIKNDDLLKETLMYYLKRIELYISLGHGNFIITSRKELYNKRLFLPTVIKNFQMYLVDEKLLPKNMLILGHKNPISFANPYVACPIIDKESFDNICDLNGIDLDDIPYDSSKKYPLITKNLDLYSLYQSYLDNMDVPYWYIETFKNPTIPRQKAYYTTLFFD